MKELSVFPTGEKNTAYAKYFIGQSYLYPLSTEQVIMPTKAADRSSSAWPAGVGTRNGASRQED